MFTGEDMAQVLSMTLTPPIIDSDLEITRQIAAGDEDALRKMYAAYGQRMYAYALRLTRDPSLAEEAVQESLVVVWKSAGNFRGQSRLLTWLLGIVHHKSLNLLRQRSDLSLDEPLEPVASGEEPPARQVEAHDCRRLIRQGLEKLAVSQRSVLELVFYNHLSLEEAARVLECPIGTVKSRLFSGRNALKGELLRAGYRLEDLL
jgi:RNA polymerase sigma-70 factor, ECF subfamily